MTSQKIITLAIDTMEGAKALRQIQEAAGPGSWRMVSMLDLHYKQGHLHWRSTSDEGPGSPVLIVLEEESAKDSPFRETSEAIREPMHN